MPPLLAATYQRSILDNDIPRSGMRWFETLLHVRSAYPETFSTGEPPHFADRTRDPIRKAVAEIDSLTDEVLAILIACPTESRRMTKPNIKLIDFGATAALVETFAASRNIPTKQYPADQPSPPVAGEGRGVPTSTSVHPVPRQEHPTVVHARRTPMRKFTVELPDYVIDEILMKSVTGKKTARHIVMTALRAINFTIHDEDMVEDGRRTRKAS